MARYRIVLRRPMGPTQPHRDRKWKELTTDQPSIELAIAWAYRQLANTRDRAIVEGLSSVLVIAERPAPMAATAGGI